MAAQGSDHPRIRVDAVLLIDGRLVLVRQSRGCGKAYYLLPGGGVEYGETLQDALVREVREETGLVCSPGPLLFVNDSIAPHGGRHAVNMTFLATVMPGQQPQTPPDPAIHAVLLVDVDRLGSYDLRPPLAAELQQAIRSDFSVPARYLGSLWRAE